MAIKVLEHPAGERSFSATTLLWAAVDSGVFASLRDLPNGQTMQTVYTVLMRRLPNVTVGYERIAEDSGFSARQVKRAVQGLTEHGLVYVERRTRKELGGNAANSYTLADLRDRGVSSGVLALIRKSLVSKARGQRKRGDTRDTPRGDAGDTPRGDTSGQTGVTPEVNPGCHPCHPKDQVKIQEKQQGAAAAHSVRKALTRWGLTGAEYLAESGHPKAIPELCGSPEHAIRVLERAMRGVSWGASSGVGARVAHLRSVVATVSSELETQVVATTRDPSNRAQAAAHELFEAWGRPTPISIENVSAQAVEAAFALLGEDAPEDAGSVPPETVSKLVAVCERRREAQSLVSSMTDREFQAARDTLLAERPEFGRFFKNSGRSSPALVSAVEQAVAQELGS